MTRLINQPKLVAACVALVIPAVLLCEGCDRSAAVPDSKTGPAADHFVELKPGMSPAEVVQLLGEPTQKNNVAAVLRAVHQRFAEFDNMLPPAFIRAASATDEAPPDPDAPLEGEHWLYGPYNDLQLGDTLTVVEFTDAKLTNAFRKKVIRPPTK